MIESLLKALELKDEKRTGQQLYSVEDVDSIADHSWSVALLTLVFGEKEELDMEKALKMAIVHDLGEAETGDVAQRVEEENMDISPEEKEEAERREVKK